MRAYPPQGVPPWWLARTRPCHERIAETNLARLGVTAYVPRFYDRSRKRRTVLFPSYAFVRIPFGVSIYGCKGVRHLVMMGESPAKVPDGLVDAYRGREVNGLIPVDGEPVFTDYGLKIGMRVKVTSGALANLQGMIELLDGKGRVKLLLDAMFNRAVTTLCDAATLEVVSAVA